MKLPSQFQRRNSQGGFVAVVIMFILLSMVLAFIVANGRVVTDLHSEIRLIEKNQMRRLQQAQTNAAPNLRYLTTTNSITTPQ